jgi:pantoate--beta-alanine ligase
MEIFKEVEPIRAFLDFKRRNSVHSIGLVPTMGALHKGHLELIKSSKKENDLTIATVYVNPTQFNNPSDLAKYPRTFEQDVILLNQAGCDILFFPSNEVMYSAANPIKIDFGELDKILEGKFRPGHFSGVGLVVSKLFNIIQPTKAYFGQKDYQQFQVISSLVEQLMFPIKLECVPTVREEDGLAMSSRNLRLTPEMRLKALTLYNSLQLAKNLLLDGIEMTNVREKTVNFFEENEVKLEYIELADRKNLIPLNFVLDPKDSILLISGYVGEVRLIDNTFLV